MKVNNFSPKAVVMPVSLLQLSAKPGCKALLHLRPVFMSVVQLLPKSIRMSLEVYAAQGHVHIHKPSCQRGLIELSGLLLHPRL